VDPIGHASIGLIVKPLAPKVPLWALLAATAVPDLLFFGFQAAGLEYQALTKFDLSHGLQYLSPPFIPWSHGLMMCIVWSVLVAWIAFLFSHNRRISILLGLMVFSHWVLDFIVYPVLPLFFDNSKMTGLGLMTSRPGLVASILLEIGLVVGGIVIYWKTRKSLT
jgi:membrane-bound metal-dependent hydrolase YbcI (DUF457 family)